MYKERVSAIRVIKTILDDVSGNLATVIYLVKEMVELLGV